MQLRWRLPCHRMGGHYYDYYEYYQYYYDYSLLQTDLDDNRQGACKCGRCSISEASLFE